jgi:pimeloyl-ACP methyl ester carboxylesterase
MAFWTDPNEASLTGYEEACIRLYTRTAPPAGFYERAVAQSRHAAGVLRTRVAAAGSVAQLDQIKCPTLIVAGEDDPITPVADMEEIAAALRPNLVRLVRFANAGHGVYRDRPGAFSARCAIL